MPARVPAGVVVEREGPLLRTTGRPQGGSVEYRPLAGLGGAALDELTARQVQPFGARGERLEWKKSAHDLPPDLAARLGPPGFAPEPEEAVAIATATAI